MNTLLKKSCILSVFPTSFLTITINKQCLQLYKNRNKINEMSNVIDEEYEIKRIIKVEEFEDEGIGFFLDTVYDGVLYLHSQYLYDFDIEGYFKLTFRASHM